MKSTTFTKNLYIKLYFLFLIFGLFVWFFMGFRQPKLWEYNDIARNLLRYHRFSYTHLGTEYLNFCPPLYSFLVAFIYLVSNYNALAVTFFQIIVYAFLCTIIFKIGKDIFNYNVGLLASVGIMLHSGILFYTLMHQHSLILDSFMIALSVFSILFLYNNPVSIKRLIICGIVVGLSSLSRGTFLLLIPLFAVWIVFVFDSPIKRRLYLSFFIVIISLLTILPWTIRNFAVHKTFILVGAASEECFWRGNNPVATGSSYDTSGDTVLYDLTPKDFLRDIYASDETGQKRIFQKATFDFIKNNPGKFIELFMKRLYYFWWFSPQSGIKYPKIYLFSYKALYSGILLFGIFGIIFALISKQRRTRQITILLLLVFLFISIVQSLFYIEGRHRWNIEPMLIIFSAKALIDIKDKLKIAQKLRYICQKTFLE